MKILQNTAKYISLSKKERHLFHQSLVLLISWKIRILILPMERYAKYFGEKGKEIITEGVSNEDMLIKCTRAVRRADSLLPWNSKCLTQAIATKRLLERYDIKSTLFLGVGKDEHQKLIAHAWLKSGKRILSGEKGHERFTIVAKFA